MVEGRVGRVGVGSMGETFCVVGRDGIGWGLVEMGRSWTGIGIRSSGTDFIEWLSMLGQSEYLLGVFVVRRAEVLL